MVKSSTTVKVVAGVPVKLIGADVGEAGTRGVITSPANRIGRRE